MSSAKWRQFRLGLNVLIKHNNLFKIETLVKYESAFQLVNVILSIFLEHGSELPWWPHSVFINYFVNTRSQNCQDNSFC